MNGFAGGQSFSDDLIKIIFIPRVGFLRRYPVHDCLAVGLQASAHVEDRHVVSLLDKCHGGRDGGRSGTYDDDHDRRTVIMDLPSAFLGRERSILRTRWKRRSESEWTR